MTVRSRLVGLALVALVGSAGCGLDPSPPPSASVAASQPPAAASASTSVPPPSPTPPLNGPSLPLAATTADPSLFTAVFGAEQPGLTFQYDADTTARVSADPGLRKDASALAIGLYTITSQQPITDYGIVSILRLRDPAAADDTWFRAYRDSYDASACAQAGGIARHAEAPIGGRTVFIGSCAGGAFTYHLRLDTQAIVVSVTSVGSGRLGERLAGAVAP